MKGPARQVKFQALERSDGRQRYPPDRVLLITRLGSVDGRGVQMRLQTRMRIFAHLRWVSVGREMRKRFENAIESGKSVCDENGRLRLRLARN